MAATHTLTPQDAYPLDISIIVPLLNEEESLPELKAWINRVCTEHNYRYEVIFIDDGSTDSSWQVIEQLREQYPDNLRARKFQRNYGKSAALHVGFQAAQGRVVLTMDADLQDSPDEIPGLYKKIVEENYDLVSGWKKKRYDPIMKTVPSKFFNWTTRKVTGIHLHDFNCGLKAYKNKVVKSVEVYGEMHRYIPFLAKKAGFKRIGEQVVQHQARKYGTSKFGLERFVNGFLDLITIWFMLKYERKPMHFFGTLGSLSFLVGFGISLFLVVRKLIYIAQQVPPEKYREVVDQPLFYFALIAIVIGMQMFLAGFLGEMVNRRAPERNVYLIDEVLD